MLIFKRFFQKRKIKAVLKLGLGVNYQDLIYIEPTDEGEYAIDFLAGGESCWEIYNWLDEAAARFVELVEDAKDENLQED